MEETLQNDEFISIHRNQINPQLHPKSTLTFAYSAGKFGKSTCSYFIINLQTNYQDRWEEMIIF